MHIHQAVYPNRRKRHQHIESLGPYEETAFMKFRTIITEWKPMERSAVVLKDLGEESGPPQGKGFLKRFQRWRKGG